MGWVERFRHSGALVRRSRDLDEPALLARLMGALAIILAGQVPMHLRAARIEPEIPFDARFSGALMAVMFIMPLLAYAMATLSALVMRGLGKPIHGRHARAALFQALLTIAPVMAVFSVAKAGLAPQPLLGPLGWAVWLVFMMLWVSGLISLRQEVR